MGCLITFQPKNLELLSIVYILTRRWFEASADYSNMPFVSIIYYYNQYHGGIHYTVTTTLVYLQCVGCFYFIFTELQWNLTLINRKTLNDNSKADQWHHLIICTLHSIATYDRKDCSRCCYACICQWSLQFLHFCFWRIKCALFKKQVIDGSSRTAEA